MRITEKEFIEAITNFKNMFDWINNVANAVGFVECGLDSPLSNQYDLFLQICGVDASKLPDNYALDWYVFSGEGNPDLHEIYEELRQKYLFTEEDEKNASNSDERR